MDAGRSYGDRCWLVRRRIPKCARLQGVFPLTPTPSRGRGSANSRSGTFSHRGHLAAFGTWDATKGKRPRAGALQNLVEFLCVLSVLGLTFDPAFDRLIVGST